MTRHERTLVHLIRTSKDPDALIQIAAAAITACQKQPLPSQGQAPAALVTTAEKIP